MKLKCVIIEDIQSYADTLMLMLQPYKEIEVVAKVKTKQDAVKIIRLHQPDLVFMDIQLGKDNGFDILDECNDDYKYVIFTTSHHEFAIRGYNYRVIHYLLKPIMESQLDIAINNAIRIFNQLALTDEIKNSFFKISQIRSEKIYFPEKNLHYAIEIDAIICIESNAAYSDIFTLNRSFKVSKNLSNIQKMLDKYPEFIRVHRSYIINKNHILTLKKGNDSLLYLTNGYEIPISNTEKTELFKRLGLKD